MHVHKKSADLHPRQVNLLHRNIFTGLNYIHKIGRITAEKIALIFNMLLQDFYVSDKQIPIKFWAAKRAKPDLLENLCVSREAAGQT
jgi:hypothetical protein